jgi:hypothetical protein
MTYIAYVECTRCGGAHALSQCPWPDGLIEAEAAAVDMLEFGTGIIQVSPDGTIRHVPIAEWMKP